MDRSVQELDEALASAPAGLTVHQRRRAFHPPIHFGVFSGALKLGVRREDRLLGSEYTRIDPRDSCVRVLTLSARGP